MTRTEQADLRRLFDPSSIAIVGASADPAKWGSWLARGALRGKHRRPVYLINPMRDSILGEPTYPSLSALSEAPDMVVICRPARDFLETVDAALAVGARVVVGITGGLGETGEPMQRVELTAVERARERGAMLLGPNCMGIVDTATDLWITAGDLPSGEIGVVSQSGNLAIELGMHASRDGSGFSRFISVGNQADLTAADLLPAFVEDSATRVLVMYVEDFRDGRRFAAAAQRVIEAGKPVILLTVGGSESGSRTARSHTGALVTDRRVVDAVCRATGILRVSTPKEAIDLARMCLSPARPGGRRVAVVADGGGHAAVAADVLSADGFLLPTLEGSAMAEVAAHLPEAATIANPIDLAGAGERDPGSYARVVEVLLGYGSVDAVVLSGFFGGYGDGEQGKLGSLERESAEDMAEAVIRTGKPLVMQTMHPFGPATSALRDIGVPVYATIEAASRSLASAVESGEPGGIPSMPQPVTRALESGDWTARSLLREAGLPFPAARLVHELQGALRAAADIGYPVALKSLGAAHKSDVGGVALDIGDAHQLRQAFEAMRSRTNFQAFSVERMVRTGGVELIVGVRWDPRFGPVTLAGVGGVHAEVLDDTAVRLGPTDELQAMELLRSLRGAPLLFGHRGRATLEVRSAARAIAKLSDVGARHPMILELEINPLLVTETDAFALDARMVLREGSGAAV